MHTCYTVGHDSLTPGIIANLTSNRDAIIVGRGGGGRLVFLSANDPPSIEDGRIMTAFRVVEFREGYPAVTLAGSPGPLDEVAVLVMVDTSRTASQDESSEGVARIAGSPDTLTETYARMGNHLSVHGLYALLPGDALRMRPIGISSSDWAHQRVIFCELEEGIPTLRVVSRAQYHKTHGKTQRREEHSGEARAQGTTVLSA